MGEFLGGLSRGIAGLAYPARIDLGTWVDWILAAFPWIVLAVGVTMLLALLAGWFDRLQGRRFRPEAPLRFNKFLAFVGATGVTLVGLGGILPIQNLEFVGMSLIFLSLLLGYRMERYRRP
jgi:quinol-cytochrome oxidoreductase complex cytochrome b subunit